MSFIIHKLTFSPLILTFDYRLISIEGLQKQQELIMNMIKPKKEKKSPANVWIFIQTCTTLKSC